MVTVNEIMVRRIKKRDFVQFFEVVNRAFGKEIEIMGLDFQRFFRIVKFYGLVDVLSSTLGVLNVHLPVILVAMSGAKVVGGVHIVPYGNKVWTIDSLVVDPNYRQCGIGRRLIKEALKYVWSRRGKKALTYVRADNIPSLRIKKKLHGEFFDERVLLLTELNETLRGGNIENNFLMREVRSGDALQIYGLCKILDHKKAKAFEISPKKFLYSPSERLMSKLGLSSSKRWVLEIQGKIVGYVHLTYTSPKEAAKIESFYLLGPSDLFNPTTLLLKRVFETLRERKIKKVVVSLNEDWKEMIRIFESLGFKLIASFYGVAHELA